MKKRNIATAMAAAMMFGGVAPVVAHAAEPQAPVEKAKDIAKEQQNLGVINVALAEGKLVQTMDYNQVYNMNSTLETNNDTLALTPDQEILYWTGTVGKTVNDTDAKYLVATKVNEKNFKANDTYKTFAEFEKAVKEEKIKLDNAKENLAQLEALTFINKNGQKEKVYAVSNPEVVKNANETKQTITLKKNADAGNDFVSPVVFSFSNMKLERDAAQLATFKDITIDVSNKAGVVELNKKAYELSKTYNENNAEAKSVETLVDKHITKTVTVTEKGTNRVLGKIILTKYDVFKADNFKGFVNIAAMKDINSLYTPELESWAKEPVLNALYEGQLNGYEDHTLRLNNSVTRAEFAKMLVEMRGMKVDSKAKENFSDVNESDWFKPYVATLAQLGIVAGDGDGTFRPNDTITRQEAAIMIAKAIRSTDEKLVKDKKLDVDRFNAVTGQPYDTKTNFKDDTNIAIWADGSVYEMAKNNVIKGYEDKTFRPENKITRAESVVMIARSASMDMAKTPINHEPIKGANIK